jgi:hypothetical protein
MKIIKINASNMNPEELEKAIKTAIKTATSESSEKQKAVDERKNTIKEIKRQLEILGKILDENSDEELTNDQLIKLLKMYQEEEKRLKNIFRIK